MFPQVNVSHITPDTGVMDYQARRLGGNAHTDTHTHTHTHTHKIILATETHIVHCIENTYSIVATVIKH